MLKWKNIGFSHQVRDVTAGNPQPLGRCPSSELWLLFWEKWTELSRQWNFLFRFEDAQKGKKNNFLSVQGSRSKLRRPGTWLSFSSIPTSFCFRFLCVISPSAAFLHHFPASFAEITESLYHFAMWLRSTEQAGSEATIKSWQIKKKK